jgi:hypothetical protein
MNISLKLFLIVSLFLTFSCKSKKNAQTTYNMGTKEQYPQAIIGEFSTKSDPFKILNAEIIGNFMEIEVQYGGGCVELHDFTLIGSPNLAKSLPPQRAIQLIHDSKNDTCKALITKKIKFSITNLAENTNKGNKVILKLENYKKDLEYSYE